MAEAFPGGPKAHLGGDKRGWWVWIWVADAFPGGPKAHLVVLYVQLRRFDPHGPHGFAALAG